MVYVGVGPYVQNVMVCTYLPFSRSVGGSRRVALNLLGSWQDSRCNSSWLSVHVTSWRENTWQVK